MKISAGAEGGPRSRVYVPFTLRSAPHQHQQEILAAHVWGGGDLDFFESIFLAFQEILSTVQGGCWGPPFVFQLKMLFLFVS